MAGHLGELVLTSSCDSHGYPTGVRIDHADPHIRISGELVREALGHGPGWLTPGCELSSDRLVIHGENRKVIYRIGAYHGDGDWYEAQWPD